MSHFTGLVILTPSYLEKHDLEESLDKYCEHNSVPEYSEGEVSDYEKVTFIHYYKFHDGTIDKAHDIKDLQSLIYERLRKDGKMEAVDQNSRYDLRWHLEQTLTREGYQKVLIEIFNELYPTLFEQFDKIYEKYGKDWNNNRWHVNPDTGKWEEYTTYNPDSKWDYYVEGGRWDGSLKLKNGEFTNSCLLGEIDWTDFAPEDYVKRTEKDMWTGEKYHPLKKNVRWHYTKSSLPFCLVIDGEWIEKGKMGWFGITTNEKPDVDWNEEFFKAINKLPENSEVHLLDFHI